jgi:transaldolase/glucose-6-phosphate isomerase
MSNENQILRAYELGQSFWLDYIRRDLLDSGELERLIEAGEIRGITSNPSIFKQAIGESDLYLDAMRPMAHAGWSAERIFETLAIEDIRAAADLLLPHYEGTDGRDGFVSIEVNPDLAFDTEKTLEEARRLWESVSRPNLMVKIPATQAGVPAIQEAIFEGINVNITLIFSLERYSEVMEAYVEGLDRRVASGQPVERVASVASFFVSRVDSAVDSQLEVIIRGEGSGAERAHALLGTAAIANAKLAYAQFKMVFEGERFDQLREVGARLQRPLWASTSTKNPDYSDVLYIEELIGQHTVNTVPPKTLKAFREHGVAQARLEAGLSDSIAQLQALEALGVSLDEVTSDLERDGVRAFAEAYASLIETVGERASGMASELSSLAPELVRYLELLDEGRVAARFWRVDPDLWPETTDGSVIKMRLEWLETELEGHLDDARRLSRRVEADKAKQIGWISSGEALGAIVEAVGSDRSVVALETLDPSEMRGFARKTPAESTLFLVESRAPFDTSTAAKLVNVWRRVTNRMGEKAGRQFIALAPAGSELEEWAIEQNIERQEEWNQSSGAPISAAGFLQAELLGGDPAELAEGAAGTRELSAPGVTAARNPSLYLGAILAAAGSSIFIVADPDISARAEWLAKYVRARAQIPIKAGHPNSEDAAVVYLRQDGAIEDELRGRGAPLIILQTEPGLHGLGSESVRWEVGVGVAAHLLNDPTYAGAPQLPAWGRLSRMVEKLQKKGSFGTPKPNWDLDYATVWWSRRSQSRAEEAKDLEEVAAMLLEQLKSGDSLFVSLYQARSRKTLKSLSTLSDSLDAIRQVSTAFEFGKPPEVKSLSGFSLMIGTVPRKDAEVPGLGVTYGDLQAASMIADYEQIKEAGGEACAILLKEPDGVNSLLMEMAEQAETVSLPSIEESNSLNEGQR